MAELASWVSNSGQVPINSPVEGSDQSCEHYRCWTWAMGHLTVDFERLSRLGCYPFTIDVTDILLEQRWIFKL